MPCRHGEVFWWDCPSCKQEAEDREHSYQLEKQREAEQREFDILCELRKIRRLLEEKERR